MMGGRVKVNPGWLIFGLALLLNSLFGVSRVTGDQGLSRDCILNEVKGNPKNEHTFYWCLSDGPVLMKCVNQLVFDSHAKKCISATEQEKRRGKRGSGSSAKNEISKLHTSPKSPYLGSYYSLASKYTASHASQAQLLPHTGGGPSTIHCPIAEYGKDAPLILIPSPDYCDTFFYCANGLPVLFQCPADTDFNPNLRVCDTMRNVKCASGKRRRDVLTPSSASSGGGAPRASPGKVLGSKEQPPNTPKT